MKACLYARVSTGEQNEGMQVRECIEFGQRAGWHVDVFADHGFSGSKESRPELDRMMRLVRQRKYDVVLVYKFDRFARSTRHLLNALEEFEALGVKFVSVKDEFDMTTPAGRLMFRMVAAFAEFERDIIRERVRSGMANARAQGIHVGRPSLGLDPREIRALRAAGRPWSAIAEQVGAGISTCQRVLREAHQEDASKGA